MNIACSLEEKKMGEENRNRSGRRKGVLNAIIHPKLIHKVIMALVVLLLVAGGSYWAATQHYKQKQQEMQVESAVNVRQIQQIGELNVLSVSYQQLVKLSQSKKISFTKITYGSALDIVEIKGQVKLGFNTKRIEIRKTGAHGYSVGVPEIKAMTISNEKQELIYEGKKGFFVKNSKEDLQKAINKQLSLKSAFADKILDENRSTAESSSKKVLRGIITGMDPEAKVSFYSVN